MHVQRSTRAKRKLLSQQVLQEVDKRYAYGVPLASIVRQLDLDLSRRALATLIMWYRLPYVADLSSETNRAINSSLFPEWVDCNHKNVQENPEGWVYIGRFPFGRWAYNADN